MDEYLILTSRILNYVEHQISSDMDIEVEQSLGMKEERAIGSVTWCSFIACFDRELQRYVIKNFTTPRCFTRRIAHYNRTETIVNSAGNRESTINTMEHITINGTRLGTTKYAKYIDRDGTFKMDDITIKPSGSVRIGDVKIHPSGLIQVRGTTLIDGCIAKAPTSATTTRKVSGQSVCYLSR